MTIVMLKVINCKNNDYLSIGDNIKILTSSLVSLTQLGSHKAGIAASAVSALFDFETRFNVTRW